MSVRDKTAASLPVEIVARARGMRSAEILDGLRAWYRRGGQGMWALYPEFRTEASWDGRGQERYIDLLAVGVSGVTGFQRIAYEIKVSRADFRREHALKVRPALYHTDRFYYATPPGLIDPAEVPVYAGLVEVWRDRRPRRKNLQYDGCWVYHGQVAPDSRECWFWRIRVPAPAREAEPPTRSFIAALARQRAELTWEAQAGGAEG
ncbi:MAG TPA: hypothetical protein VNJ05_05865 [Sphingomicrobium sp.]|nr:hypothetical protein [Sphingomicrobium sp.]